LKLKKYETYLKKSLEALRKIGQQLTTQSERKGKRSFDHPLQVTDLDKEMYKESVNILGVSMDELEEFMNPSSQEIRLSGVSKTEKKHLIDKLEKALMIPDSLNTDLEQICDYCVKLIHDLNPNADL